MAHLALNRRWAIRLQSVTVDACLLQISLKALYVLLIFNGFVTVVAIVADCKLFVYFILGNLSRHGVLLHGKQLEASLHC